MVVVKQAVFFLYALLCYPFVKMYSLSNPHRNVWLVGENAGECLHDNGYFFFKYCIENTSEDVFFIVSKRSINYDEFLQNNNRVLHYGTLKHVVCFLVASTCFFTHTYRDIAYKNIFKLFKKDMLKVFLQHGVLGFGNITKWYGQHMGKLPPDLFILSAPHEKNILHKYFPSVPRTAVSLTGLARYDWLETNMKDNAHKTILYIPTSRDWAISNYENSEYFKRVSSLLTNSSLEQLIDSYDVTFKCYLHKKMRDCLKILNPGPCIKIIKPGETTVHELIKSSSLMITDYSSVSWDFFYIGKPVIFYQFDQKEYLTKQGAYVEYEEFNFGEVITEENELISSIERYCKNQFSEVRHHGEKRSDYFGFYDRNNCKRIYNEATRRISEPK